MTQIPQDVKAATLRQVKAALWRRGDLSYLLHATQQKMVAAMEASTSRSFFVLCSRRLGKSYLMVVRAIEACLKTPNARVLYLAPFAKDANEIAVDLAGKILEEAPKECRPEYRGQTRELAFPNGSLIRIKGVNGEHAQFLRGGAADLVILDECGIMDDLQHVLSDVVLPMTMTTGGKVILATTPSRSPAHEAFGIYERLAGQNAVVKFTIADAPHVDDLTKAEYLIAAGESPDRALDILRGTKQPETTTAKREYFCEWVTDASSAVVPEFTKAKQAEIIKFVQRPAFFDAYVAMDPGFQDRTGILFGYWDFLSARLVIEDEALLHRANTQDIAQAITEKETALWGADKTPYMRVSDVDLRLISDLWNMHKLQFSPTRKEDSLGAINVLRNMVQTAQIVINPKCVHLIRQLEHATWNRKATDFLRGGDVDGHFDLVAALKYMTRNINRTRNPYPNTYYKPGGAGGVPINAYFSPKSQEINKQQRMGLFADTPLGRRLAGVRKKTW